MLNSEIERLTVWLKVLAEPNRLRLLDLIMEGYQCNCQLGEELNLPANLISHHLGVLKEAGLVKAERDLFDARWVYFSVSQAALQGLSSGLGQFLDPKRIRPRRLTCGPQSIPIDELQEVTAASGGAP